MPINDDDDDDDDDRINVPSMLIAFFLVPRILGYLNDA